METIGSIQYLVAPIGLDMSNTGPTESNIYMRDICRRLQISSKRLESS